MRWWRCARKGAEGEEAVVLVAHRGARVVAASPKIAVLRAEGTKFENVRLQVVADFRITKDSRAVIRVTCNLSYT